MQRELPLLGVLVAVLLAMVLAAALGPGALAETEEQVPPGAVSVSELAITEGTVGGETVELSTDVRLRQRHGLSRNLSLEVRAVDSDSDLIETTERIGVGDVRGDRELTVPANLTVEREGAYRIEAILYRDGRRESTGHREVRGVEALTPEYARTAVEFHRFALLDRPVIEYSIDEVAEDRATLDVSTYVTNTGDGPSEDLDLLVKARQAESNIVADEARIDLPEVGPGRTVRPEATLRVPDGYNYHLDAELWRDGVLVGTARSAANLNPTEEIDTDTERREVELETGAFQGEDANRGPGGPTPTQAPDDAGPGFGVGVTLVALLVAVVAAASLKQRHD